MTTTLSPTKNEILSAIAKTNDPNLKMILLLMLGLMEEIGSKIDRIYIDKELLKDTVLNGHAEVHHDDHEWIRKHREDYEIRKSHMIRAEPAIAWVEERMQQEKNTQKHVKSKIVDVVADILKALLWAGIGITIAHFSGGTISLPTM